MDRTDAEVRNDVCSALAHDIRVDFDQLGVDVANGTVFLKGTVTSLYDKRILTEIASRIKGVLGVVNEVNVVATTNTDEEIASEIRAALARDEWVDENRVELTVRDGVVRISGKVDSYAQKHNAEADVWPIPGVVDIINDMVVEAAPSEPDSEITGEALR